MTKFDPSLPSPQAPGTRITWRGEHTGGRRFISPPTATTPPAETVYTLTITGDDMAPVTQEKSNGFLASFPWTPAIPAHYKVKLRVTPSQPNGAAVERETSFNIGVTGGGGGSAFLSNCTPGTVLVGIAGRSGNLVDAVQPVCVPVKSDGSWKLKDGPVMIGSSPYAITYGTRVGGSGGTAFQMMWDPGSAVMSIFGRSGNLVDSAGIRCGKIGLVYGALQVGSITGARGPFGGGGGSPYELACPTGLIAVRLWGWAGAYIDQLSVLDCAAPPPVP